MIESLLMTGLVLALIGLLLTLPIMLRIRWLIERAVQGIGRVLVDQLILDKAVLTAATVLYVAARLDDDPLPMAAVLVVVWTLAVSPGVFLVRWLRWRLARRRED